MPDAKSTYDALDAICGDLAAKPLGAAIETAKAQLPNIDPTNQGAVAFVNNLIVVTANTVDQLNAARTAAYSAANPPPPLPASGA